MDADETCTHEETHTVCDGTQHTEVCFACGDDVSYDSCDQPRTCDEETPS